MVDDLPSPQEEDDLTEGIGEVGEALPAPDLEPGWGMEPEPHYAPAEEVGGTGAASSAPVLVPSPVAHPPEATPLPLVEAPEYAPAETVLERISEGRQAKLMTRVDDLLEQIFEQRSVDTSQDTLEEALKLLKTARHTLIENPRDYDTAEYHTHRAKIVLERFHRVRKDSLRWPGWALAVYQIIFSLLVGLGWGFGGQLLEWVHARGAAEWALSPWFTMMAGAAGGVCGAIWALYQHMSIEQDFDRQHTMWYIGSPFTGALLGAVLFFMVRAGVLAMGLTGSSDLAAELPGLSMGDVGDWFVFALTWLVGFQQNVALDLFARFLRLIRPERDEPPL